MRLGRCDKCGQRGIWVNNLRCKDAQGEVFEGEACAQCFERLNILQRRPPGYRSRVRTNEDPMRDNAIRALEDGGES